MNFDKVPVLVTGGAHGIGWSTAKRFLDAGAIVAIWALHPQSVETLQNTHPNLLCQTVDVGDLELVQKAHRDLLHQLGPLQILINNAGYTDTTRFLDETPEYWQRVVATNLWGVIHTCHTFLPDMVNARRGSVVNVVSDAGRVGMAGEAVYAASKGGVIAFSKSIAQEMARFRIRVNCVSPGPTRTRILESNSSGEEAQKLIEKMIQRIPLRQIAEPEEVADAIVFFAGESASHITGQVLSVSGGLTMM